MGSARPNVRKPAALPSMRGLVPNCHDTAEFPRASPVSSAPPVVQSASSFTSTFIRVALGQQRMQR
eukprot:6038782-Alexandrium_andersonii.AAC.1